MIEIYKFGNEWQVHTAYEGAFAGTFQGIMKFCMKEIRVPEHELIAAIETMDKYGHNASHFGVNRSLLYTFDKTTKKMEN